MVITVVIILLCLAFIAGLISTLQGAGNRFYWPEVPGEVIGFTESIKDWGEDGGKEITYIPTIKYSVKGKEYTAQSSYHQNWREKDFTKKVAVLYDPDKPERIYLKDSSMVVGCFTMIFALIGIGLLLWFTRD